jgi:hypothetical protein
MNGHAASRTNWTSKKLLGRKEEFNVAEGAKGEVRREHKERSSHPEGTEKQASKQASNS